LAILLLSLVVAIIYSPLLWLSGLTFILFMISSIPLLRLIWDNDRIVVLPAIPMIFIRAGAL